MTRPLVVAHRGHSALFPENTLAAYEAAIAAGADIVETDARLTADGVVVSAHDADIGRIAGVKATIAGTRCADLVAMSRARGVELPTLAQSLTAICRTRRALIDVKTTDLVLIDAIAAVLRDLGVADRVWIGARNAGQLARASERIAGPRLLAFLPEDGAPEPFAKAGAEAFRLWERDLDGPVAQSLFGHRPVWVTCGGSGTGRRVGDVGGDDLRAILARQPDAILLNDPELLTLPVARKAP